MPDDTPTSDDSPEDSPPPSTITDASDSEADPNDEEDDLDTITLELSGIVEGDLVPGNADSRQEELRRKRTLGIITPEEKAELVALQSGKDPEEYPFEAYARDMGFEGAEIEQLRKEMQADAREERERLADRGYLE